jgi:hypothetical protein
MKTDQLMTVCFQHGDLHISHKSMMGSLTDLFSIGNKMRGIEGKGMANMTLFIKSAATQDFIRVICEEQGCDPDSVITQTGRGKSSRTEANLHLLIYAAEYLSTRFHYQVIDIFVAGKLLQLRDGGGDEFKLLNIAIDRCLPGREGKPNNQGCYINIAKVIRSRCNLVKPENDATWNQALANKDAQLARYDMQHKLVNLLELGLVRDWEHLKELAGRV